MRNIKKVLKDLEENVKENNLFGANIFVWFSSPLHPFDKGQEWDHLHITLGFQRENGWYRKPYNNAYKIEEGKIIKVPIGSERENVEEQFTRITESGMEDLTIDDIAGEIRAMAGERKICFLKTVEGPFMEIKFDEDCGEQINLEVQK